MCIGVESTADGLFDSKFPIYLTTKCCLKLNAVMFSYMHATALGKHAILVNMNVDVNSFYVQESKLLLATASHNAKLQAANLHVLSISTVNIHSTLTIFVQTNYN